MWGVVIAIGAGLYIVSRAFGGHKKGDTITEDEIDDAKIIDDDGEEEGQEVTCHRCRRTDIELCPKCGKVYICPEHRDYCECWVSDNQGYHKKYSCGCHKNWLSSRYCSSCD